MSLLRVINHLGAKAGQGLIEYALIGGFISIAATLILTGIGGEVNEMLTSVSNSFPP